MKKLFKNKNVAFSLLGVLLGGLLIVFGMLTPSDKSENSETNLYPSNEIESYTSSLENKISEHLEKINGVSKVSVIITIDGSNEKVYATNGTNKDYVITKDSNGNENALVLTEIIATVRGIAVVCDYNNNNELKQQIISMLSSLFNIGTNRISVMSA